MRARGFEALYHASDLTIINVWWPATIVVMPHNHAMWAVIGVDCGREDNILRRRLPDEAAGAKALSTGVTLAFGADVIHSVTNPISQMTGVIHVYGGISSE